jgi:hypothetical protein
MVVADVESSSLLFVQIDDRANERQTDYGEENPIERLFHPHV